jgi:oligoribonuclease NrnB/cAMP/cGMP phosphodiesterase (DHH superfamily)
MGCCDDPTEPVKINRTDVARIQQQYGDLIRDLFTSDPEKVMLKQLHGVNTYLTELAALNAHYDSVREQAITSLGKDSVAILQQIVDKQPESQIGQCAAQRIEYLKTEHGLFSKIFS